MKIMICASVTFAKSMLEVKEKLEKRGHTILISDDAPFYIESPETKLSFEEELKLAQEQDILNKALDKVSQSDAIVVLNYEKNNIKGYLGTSVLMELAVAYHLKKKIFLLNEIDKTQNYALEVELINPIILNGDLNKIKP